MHWIVERAARDEDTDPLLWIATGRRSRQDDMARLVEVLETEHIPHDVVRKVPFTDHLIGMHDEVPLHLSPDGPVYAYGSTTMDLVSKASGWTPGFIDAPEMLEAISHWGTHMLNHDVRVAEIGTMETPEGSFFIRPDSDGKAFAGHVIADHEFAEWRRRILDVKGWTSIPPTTRVLYGPVRRIEAEWRLAIVEGRVAASSLYRDGGRLRNVCGCPAEVEAYAIARAGEWHPRPAFVMDIAQTPDGLRIVETNSISSAGFYAMDMGAYVHAIETSALAR